MMRAPVRARGRRPLGDRWGMGDHPRRVRTTEGSDMAVMRVAQVSRAGGPFEIVERPIPEPGAGSVRIKVLACGICHSDSVTKDGLLPGIQYPRVPGHEV